MGASDHGVSQRGGKVTWKRVAFAYQHHDSPIGSISKLMSTAGAEWVKRADRHVIGAGRGQLRNAIERHAARNLDLRSAARRRDRLANLLEGHVVEEHDVRRRRQAPRRPPSRHCASTSIGRPAKLAHRATRLRGHSAGQADVIVLDQDGIEEAGAMVRAAARRPRHISRARATSGSSFAYRAR